MRVWCAFHAVETYVICLLRYPAVCSGTAYNRNTRYAPPQIDKQISFLRLGLKPQGRYAAQKITLRNSSCGLPWRVSRHTAVAVAANTRPLRPVCGSCGRCAVLAGGVRFVRYLRFTGSAACTAAVYSLRSIVALAGLQHNGVQIL